MVDSAPNTYNIGTTVKCRAVFTDKDLGTPIDPTVVTFSTRKPDDSVYSLPDNDPLIVRESVGIFFVLLLADLVGDWWYRFNGSTTAAVAEETHFIVKPSKVMSN